MHFVTPAWLHLGWLVLALLSLRWFVVGRRTERTSTMLIWRRLLDSSPDLARRASFKPDTESTLEALLGFLLVLIIAGPLVPRSDERATRWIVDMGAAMSSPGRAAEVSAALRRVSDRDTVVRASDLSRALAEARASGDRVRLVADVIPQPLPDDVEVVAVTKAVQNVGFTVFEARRRGNAVEVFAVVESCGPSTELAVRCGDQAVAARVSPDAPAEVSLIVPEVDGSFRVELELDDAVRNDIVSDDVITCDPRPTARAVVADGIDFFADALAALGLDVLEGAASLAVGDDLLVTSSAELRSGPTLRIVAIGGSIGERGELVPLSPAFRDVSFSGLVASAAPGLSGRPVLTIGGLPAAAVTGRTLTLGFDLDGVAERPVFPLLVRALLQEIGFVGGDGGGGFDVVGVLDRRETLGRADDDVERAVVDVDKAEQKIAPRNLRPQLVFLALVVLAALVRIRTARPARGSASSR